MSKRTAKQERAERTRIEILQAAIELFARRGILATTMNELAKAIKMTPGALYWHFPTKEDLLLAAMEELHRRFIGEFTEVMTEGRKWPAQKQLRVIVERQKNFFRYHPTHGIFYAMLSCETPFNSQRICDALRETLTLYAEFVASIIRYGQKKGEFRTDVDALAFSHAMLSSHLGLIVHQQLFQDTLTYERICDALDVTVASGFETPPQIKAAG